MYIHCYSFAWVPSVGSRGARPGPCSSQLTEARARSTCQWCLSRCQAGFTLVVVKNRIRVLRAERGWSQTELAELIGVSRQTVSSIEAERSEPSLSLAFDIAEAFGVAIEDVFTRPSTKPPWERAPQVPPPS